MNESAKTRDNWKWTRRTFKLLVAPFILSVPLLCYEIAADNNPKLPTLPTILQRLKKSAPAIGGIVGFSTVIPAGYGSVGLTKWGIHRYRQRKLRMDSTHGGSPNNTAPTTGS